MSKKLVWIVAVVIALAAGVSVYTLHVVGPETFLRAVAWTTAIIVSAFVVAWVLKTRLSQ